VESSLRLTGWSAERRVVVLRREVRGDVLLEGKKPDGELEFAFMEAVGAVKKYEYAVLVTSLGAGVLTLAQHYRDRADSENPFDELKNRWGWGGFTTQDLGRCQIMARLTAQVYN
jgi:hypothetical protein